MVDSRQLTNWTLLCALGAAAAFAGCGGTQEPAEAPEPAPAPSVEDAASEPDDASADEAALKFADMTPPQKMKHMKTVVTPAMAKVFKEFDAEVYADFDCSTCHGEGAKQGNFAMPNAALPLNQHEIDEHPEMSEFMKTRVVPEMAQVMGEAPFDPATNEGFGCYDCHTEAE